MGRSDFGTSRTNPADDRHTAGIGRISSCFRKFDSDTRKSSPKTNSQENPRNARMGSKTALFRVLPAFSGLKFSSGFPLCPKSDRFPFMHICVRRRMSVNGSLKRKREDFDFPLSAGLRAISISGDFPEPTFFGRENDFFRQLEKKLQNG